ncbi:MAG: DUF2804 domain-containing protein [Treponema sp.]|jgi:hypothetical protein|nr:DUF2804 domain-containing protein [Treponema sp.]
MPQNEITTPVSVLNGSGTAQNFGWSRQPGFFYDPALVWAPRRRFSESDRYIVFSPTHLVIFEVRDDGFLGYMGISIISLKDRKRSTQLFQTLLPLGSYEMPTGSETGAIRYRHRKASLDFIPMEGGARIIRADIPKFGHHRSLRGELVLSEPRMAESLVTNLPWRHEKSAFRYTRRSPWFSVEGVIQFGTAEMVFTKGKAWGIFDWNRGVRPRTDVRYWASSCGLSEKRLVGFSIGYGSADSSAGTENAFFVDGKIHKLDQVTFNIPPSNWLLPWRFTSNDNRLEMTFSPHQERIERNSLFFHAATRRQVCGFFSGRALLDDGSVMEFQNITGFAERSKTRF